MLPTRGEEYERGLSSVSHKKRIAGESNEASRFSKLTRSIPHSSNRADVLPILAEETQFRQTPFENDHLATYESGDPIQLGKQLRSL